MIIKLLTEHHLEFLSLKGGCRGSPESTHVKISNCWKAHAFAHYYSTYHINGIIFKCRKICQITEVPESPNTENIERVFE